MNAAPYPMEVTRIVTDDMRLPAGSTVVQCILHQAENGDKQLDIRCVTIGADQYDENNPAHRFLSVVANRLPEIMAEVSENAEMVTTGNIEARLAAALAADEGDDEGSLA